MEDIEKKMSDDCEVKGEAEHKRSRGDSNSSTQTTQTVESFIMCNNRDYIVNLQCLQHQESKCDDTYQMEENDEELMKIEKNDEELIKNKIDHLNAFNYDVHRYGLKTKKRRRDWKFVAVILTILVLVLVFAFFWEFKEIQSIKTKLEFQDTYRMNPQLPKAEPFLRPPPDGFTAISLRGNGQVQLGRQGFPIHSWKCHFKQGEIDFREGKKIIIKKSGLYNLYAQMFFFQNAVKSPRNFSMNPVMDFGVSKVRTNERVIAATVSINSCRVACTRHVSGIVRLEKDDILSVDTATPGVYFKMIKEKAFFGTYLISDKESVVNQGSPS